MPSILDNSFSLPSAQAGCAASRPTGTVMLVLIALCLLPGLACYEVIEPVPDPLTILLDAPDTATADGASLSQITITVDSTLPPDKRTVSLTTTAGTFTATGTATASVRLDDARAVTALLRAPADSTIAVLTATADNAAVTGRLVFRRAQPERLDLVPEQFTLKAGITNDIEITAFLRRQVGRASPGVLVTFTATDTSTAQRRIGRFNPSTVVSDSTGVVTTRFTTADAAVRGPVVIRATSSPGAVVGAAVVEITPP